MQLFISSLTTCMGLLHSQSVPRPNRQRYSRNQSLLLWFPEPSRFRLEFISARSPTRRTYQSCGEVNDLIGRPPGEAISSCSRSGAWVSRPKVRQAQLGGIGRWRGKLFSYVPARFDYGPALPHPPANNLSQAPAQGFASVSAAVDFGSCCGFDRALNV